MKKEMKPACDLKVRLLNFRIFVPNIFSANNRRNPFSIFTKS